jgi:hypothetical protein
MAFIGHLSGNSSRRAPLAFFRSREILQFSCHLHGACTMSLPIEEKAALYERLWSRFWRTFTAYTDDVQRIACDEEAQVDAGYAGVFRVSKFWPDQVLWSKLEAIVVQLARAAETAFSPPGAARLDIDINLLLRRLDAIRENGNWQDFSPLALYEQLQEEYGGNTGAELVYRKAAYDIAYRLGLTPERAVERKSGQVVLSLSVWLDEFDRKWSDQTNLSYSCVESLNELGRGLSAFFQWANREDLDSGFCRLILERFDRHPRRVNSRERIRIGNDLALITYQSRFEFRLSPDLATLLRLFLSEHAPQFQSQPDDVAA